MNDAVRTYAALLVTIYLLTMAGCDGCFSFGGPGLPYSIDGEKHHIKIGQRAE